MTRAAVVGAIVFAGAAALTAQARRVNPAADPATDLVRVRAIVSMTSAAVDLTIDHASLANVQVTQVGGQTIRGVQDTDAVHLTGNTAGVFTTVRIDLILAGVRPGASIGWTTAPVGVGTATLDIDNINGGSAVSISHVSSSDRPTRVAIEADRLRQSGPLPQPGGIDSRLVLGIFYPWWEPATWSLPLFIDAPLAPYSSQSVADLTRIMAQAKGTGLDALLVSWSGRDFDGGVDHRRMLACLAAASAAGMKTAVFFETPAANPQHENGLADPETVQAWLTDVVDEYASQPAYLRVDGRPVVLAYASQRMSAAGWTQALERLRATGRDVLLIGENLNTLRLPALDGQFYYASNELAGDDIRTFDRTQSLNVRTEHLMPGDRIGRRIWAATVSPGYDDTHINDGRTPRVTDREDGRYYERQWQAALDMRADWIVITTWNEWLENTGIEPSGRYGDKYLSITRDQIARFRRALAVPR